MSTGIRLFLEIVFGTILVMDGINFDKGGVGADLATARQALNLTISDVAKRAGIASSHLWNIEHGKKEMSFEKFIAICVALGLPPGQLAADNIFIERDHFFQAALREAGVKFPISEGRDGSLVMVSDYAAGCAVIILSTTLELAGIEDYELPSQSICDSLAATAFRLNEVASVKERSAAIANFRQRPLMQAHALGLMGETQLKEFSEWSLVRCKQSGSWVPWEPERRKGIDALLARPENTTPSFDPLVLGATFRKLAEDVAGNVGTFPNLAPAVAKKISRKGLTHFGDSLISGKMNRGSYWKPLRERLAAKLSKFGAKSSLAREFKVTPASVSEWLSGDSMPTAETTLRLLEWVQVEEEKTKIAGGATNTSSVTRLRKSSYEKTKPSRKKR